MADEIPNPYATIESLPKNVIANTVNMSKTLEQRKKKFKAPELFLNL